MTPYHLHPRRCPACVTLVALGTTGLLAAALGLAWLLLAVLEAQ